MLILTTAFLAFMILGLPVAVAMAGSSLLYILVSGSVPDIVVAQRMISGIESFPLLAVPFFILAGNLMNIAGITGRIYEFAVSLVGWMRGGLGQVNIIGSVIFSGMSGTAIADAAGLGSIEIKAMKDHGYDTEFAVGVTAASATLGPIIPPSLPFVIYGMMANVSVGALFLAGILPGGIMAILGELDRAGRLHTDVATVHTKTMKDALDQWDIARNPSETVKTFYMAGPGGVPSQVAFSQNSRWPSLDLDRAEGCIRSFDHAFSKEGGLAVLRGNIALDGCVVKTAGVDDSLLVFEGPAHVVESQDEAVEHILNDQVKAGDIVVVRYEGPKGGPGMQEMLYPTSYIKSKGLGKACALLTDGRFSGGTSGLSIGHCSPEAAAGGNIGLVRNGDRIRIDIPNRTVNVLVSDDELAKRRVEQDKLGWKPALPRPRKVSSALKAYALLATSADKGAVRDVSLLD